MSWPGASLRNWEQPEARRRDISAVITEIMGQAQPEQTEEITMSTDWHSHTIKGVKDSIARLEAQGITQLPRSALKTMSSEQIVEAKEQGRLQQIMLEPNEGGYGNSSTG